MTNISEYQDHLAGLYQRCVDYPATVSIETFVSCNAACTFCPYPQLARRGDRMTDALIDKIINDLTQIPRNHPFEVNLSRVNEPFLDTRIFDIAAKVNNALPQASLIFFSNGTPLNDRNIQRLKDVRSVNRLNISLNEVSAERYQDLMQLPFANTVKALDAVYEANLPYPVVVSRVGDHSGRDQAFIDWVTARYPKFLPVVSPRSDWLGLKPDGDSEHAVPEVGCTQWFKLHFLADGREAFCCIDAEGKWGKGDVGTTSALEIYNTPERRAIRLSRVSRLQGGALCSSCPLFS
jgi:hypothetical protein